MSLSITNAPAVFIDLMNRFCRPFLNRLVIVFIDDILIYLKIEKEQEKHLREVLQVLKNQKLYAKFSNFKFWLQEIQFLRNIVSRSGIMVDPVKIEAFMKWEHPKNPTKVYSFPSLAGQSHHFIPYFSRITNSLTKLTRKISEVCLGLNERRNIFRIEEDAL